MQSLPRNTPDTDITKLSQIAYICHHFQFGTLIIDPRVEGLCSDVYIWIAGTLFATKVKVVATGNCV